MKEIIESIPVLLKLKDYINVLIDSIPLLAAIAAVGALTDIPGTIRTIRNIAQNMERWFRHR